MTAIKRNKFTDKASADKTQDSGSPQMGDHKMIGDKLLSSVPIILISRPLNKMIGAKSGF